MKQKVDIAADTMTIDGTGLVRIDGVAICRRLVHGGIVCLQFADRDKLRSRARGTRLVLVPLEAFVDKLG